jgi:hypothetical protein
MVTESELDVEKLPDGGIAISLPGCQPVPTTSGPPHVELQAQSRPHWTKKAIVPFLMLALVQFLIATFVTLCKVALVSGIDPFFFTFYRNLVGFFFLAPFAYYLEW